MSASAAGPGSAVPVAVTPKTGSGPTPAVIETVSVTIDGKPSPFPKGTNVLEAAQPGSAPTSPRSATTPGCRSSRSVPAVPGRVEKSTRSCCRRCYSRSPTRWWCHTRRRACSTLRAAAARVHAAQPPDRLPDLRQGGRVHAAEAVLRSRNAKFARNDGTRSTRTRSSTSARTSCSIRSAASCARAASASATRSRVSTSSRWRTAVTTRC